MLLRSTIWVMAIGLLLVVPLVLLHAVGSDRNYKNLEVFLFGSLAYIVLIIALLILGLIIGLGLLIKKTSTVLFEKDRSSAGKADETSAPPTEDAAEWSKKAMAEIDMRAQAKPQKSAEAPTAQIPGARQSFGRKGE